SRAGGSIDLTHTSFKSRLAPIEHRTNGQARRPISIPRLNHGRNGNGGFRPHKKELIRMNFEYSGKVQALQKRVAAFMDEYIYPNEKTYHEQIREGDRWQPTAIVEQLKPIARAAGLWNLFLPESERGAGLTNLEYA